MFKILPTTLLMKYQKAISNLLKIILINYKKTSFDLVFFFAICYTFIMIISFIVAAVIVAIDQLTKILIYGTAARSIIGNLLWFESTLNTGVAFSMFENNSYIFIITSIIASVIISWLIASKKYFTNRLEKITLALILGGTIGNVIDRIIFGGVRDFISLKFINFAIFNVADMAITIGAAILAFYILLSMFKTNKNNSLNKTETNQVQTEELSGDKND